MGDKSELQLLIEAQNKASDKLLSVQKDLKSLGKEADDFTRKGANFDNLSASMDDWLRALKSSTPENLKFAQSMATITKSFQDGKISSQEAADKIEVLKKEMDNVNQSANKAGGGTKSFLNDLNSLKTSAVAAAGTIAAVGIAAKKAFDLGAEGAVVQQTARSFEYLIEKTNASQDTLQRLREASGITVDDLTLMSSTETLVAGTTDQVAQALINAAPELMSYAKAANKLNPELGTTDYMFRSIAEGVKKGQPEILDNLGLAIKLQPAYESYASSLGKTVDQLTAEEKILAVLNDTQRAGAILIEQVGGNTESVTDSFEAMKAASKNLADMMRQQFTPAASEAAKALTKFMEAGAENINIHNKINQAIGDGVITQREANALVRELNYGLRDESQIMGEINTRIASYNLAQMDAVSYADLMNNAHGMLAGSLIETNTSMQNVVSATADYTGYQEAMVQLTQSYVEAQRNAVVETENLAMSMKNATGADIARQSIEGLTAAYQSGAISEGEYRREFEEIGKQYGLVNERSMQLAAGQSLLEDALKTGAMSTDDYSGAVTYLYQTAGNVDNINQAMIDKFGIMPEKLGANKKSFEETATSLQEKFNVQAGEANSILGDIFARPDYKDFVFTIRWVEEGSPPATFNTRNTWSSMSYEDVGTYEGRESGGNVYKNTTYLVGERGPELFDPSTNGSIIPNDRLMGGDKNIVNNITINHYATISLGDRYEAQEILMPFIEEGLRRAGLT